MTRKKDGIQAMPPFFFILLPTGETLCITLRCVPPKGHHPSQKAAVHK